jgi:hypothetical protein
MGETRNEWRLLVRKPLCNQLFGSPRRWEDNIIMDLSEIGYLLRNGCVSGAPVVGFGTIGYYLWVLLITSFCLMFKLVIYNVKWRRMRV